MTKYNGRALEADRGERRPAGVGCQGVFSLKGGIANVLGVDKEKVRVLTGNIGGCSA
jgi:hypothetical protein